MDLAERLADELRLARDERLLVLTGAGVSLASGIPTFRGSDPGAVWQNEVLEKGTLAYFQADPVASWRWYLSRFQVALEARPNPAHRALAALERWHSADSGAEGTLTVTQNVDTLHEQAGTRRLIKVHGSVDRLRCSRDGCPHGAPSGWLPREGVDLAPLQAAPGPETLPRCRACAAPLRPHVLWFDELYDGHDDYQFHRLRRFIREEALTVLLVGTSLSVGVTDLVVRNARYLGQRLLLLDPGPPPELPPGTLLHLRGPAEQVLPAACAALGLAG